MLLQRLDCVGFMIQYKVALLVEVILLICLCLDTIQSTYISNNNKVYKIPYYSGRGAFETMGAGVEMSKDDIAFKCNFSYINDTNDIVERRRVDRHFDWGIPLCDALNGMKIPGFDEYLVACEYATEHRCGLKVTGKGLSSLITGTDPLKDNKKLLVLFSIINYYSNVEQLMKMIKKLCSQLH